MARQFSISFFIACLLSLSQPMVMANVLPNSSDKNSRLKEANPSSSSLKSAANTTQNKALPKTFTARQWLVSSAHPAATAAGEQMLEEGGNAIDAMVAVQTVLGLVEPQSSGLGGGSFLLLWDAKENKLRTFDGRETAPSEVNPSLFLDKEGKPMGFYQAVVGGLAVGTPGTPRLLHDIHSRYGKLAWRRTLTPAIELARSGFTVSPRLAKMIVDDATRINRYPNIAAYFLDAEGFPLEFGEKIVNPDYARTLELIAENIEHFYQGKIADDVVTTVRNAPDNPGYLSRNDLEDYKIIERRPVCARYFEYTICGMGPPSSGGITVGQIMNMLSHFPLKNLGPFSAESWRLIGETSRLAFADRNRYIADSDYVPVPVDGLLNPNYLKARANSIPKSGIKASVAPGRPDFDHANIPHWADDESLELPSTTHFSIVDPQGNIVSMTSSIENGFGSRLMTRGFLLNNELTDFSFNTHKNGYPIANRVEPRKRPRSSMSPTLVFKKGKPYMAIGSPGGSRIIGYVVKTLVAHLTWGFDIQAAINMANIVNNVGTVELEANTNALKFKKDLERMGYKANVIEMPSGLHGFTIKENIIEGGADPRRDGNAKGK